MKENYKIAQFGAFDVESYGDSLFPYAFLEGVKEHIKIDSVTLFSPSEKLNGYNGNTVYSYHEFEEINKKVNFDCLVVGGGELFHFLPIYFKNSNGEQVYEEGYLWKKPLEWANKYNIPVIMNGVGVPYSFTKEQRDVLSDMLKNVVYFSVRDEYSYERMKGLVSEDILQVVPDTVWSMKHFVHEQDMEAKKKDMEKKFHCDLSKPYMVLQYGTTYELDNLLAEIESIKQKYQFQIVVLPINYSHEDLDAVRYIEQQKKSEMICINELLQPIEIVSLIAGAKAFVGTSLHGNLTAMCYHVPSIAIDMYPTIASKMDGLFQMLNMDNYVIADAAKLSCVFDNLMEDKNYSDKLKQSLEKIDKDCEKHFQHMAQALLSVQEKQIIESTVSRNSSVPVDCEYKKMYVKYVDENSKNAYLKCIGKLVNKECTFAFTINGRRNSVIELLMTIACPTYIEIKDCNVDGKPVQFTLKKESVNASDIYLERNVRMQLLDIPSGKIKITCKMEEKECSDIEKAYFTEYNNKNMHVEKLLESERNYVSKIDSLTKENDKIKKELLKKTNKLEKTEIKVNNQRGHIEQLLEVDRNYHRIIHSKGWRLVSFPGRMFEKLFPIGTPRRNRISTIAKYIRALNWTNIKFVCAAFKKGGMKQVKKELNAFEHRSSEEMPQQQPDIYEIEEITDIRECDKLTFNKYDKPDVSIVIPVYNQFTYTYNCLKSILENSGDVSYEIIIADDVSNDLTLRLSEVAKNITIVRNKENQMFLRNCNNAAKYAKGKYILFLNNDTQVQKDWLKPLVTLIESDDSIGMVGSKLIYPDGSLQEAGGIIWGDGHAWNYGNGQNPALPQFNYVKEVDYISGAAILIRTSLWKEIGGFDDHFAPAYCEDSDLAFEVRKHGYKLMYQPLSVVVHFEGKSNGTDTSTGIKSYQVENSKKLAEKWKEEFKKQSQTEMELFRARERSQNKKVILVIDHYVPTYDKDAGSKTTYQYLKMFVKQGYSVKFLGDNFYQDEPYTTQLQQLGIEVLYGPWYAQNYKQWILDNQEYIDFAYLNRPHITEKYIDFLKEETNIKCIYYGHDLHFLRIKREYELNGDEKLLAESEEWRRKELDIMYKADINYYPSYVEVDEIHKIDKTIPAKAITAYVYEQFREDISLDFAKKNGILFVGGFGHPPNEDAVLWFVDNVYPFIRKEQDIPFYIVGSKASDKIKKLDGKNGIIVKGFVSEEELETLYNTCKVVVVPLRYGAGVKGKVVEALYYGTPMVTTTVGIEGIKGAEEFMEVTDDAKEFAKKVLALYNDNDKLVETVLNYQNYVKQNNSIEAVWNIVKEDFQ